MITPRGVSTSFIVGLAIVLFAPAEARAQGAIAGSIVGVVRDSSGGVLPGATVEAASPALIEKVRTAVTDNEGLYRLVDLRPGTYTVTVTLPGFGSVRRENVAISAGFTATVNLELTVGAVEETVTVSGAAPIVDTRNSVQQTTLQATTLDALPTTRSMGSYSTLVPGATSNNDVGGLSGERGAAFGVHGGRTDEININQDGLNVTMLNSAVYSYNPSAVEEVVVEVSGTDAETFSGGVRVNIVPKDGGNMFSGGLNFSYTNPDMQSSNLSDDLITRGLLETPSVRKNYSVGGALGGPVMRDKLWFFTAHRQWTVSSYIPGNFFNKLQGTLFYEADRDRPAYTTDYFRDHSLRLTWQATSKDKVSLLVSLQDNCNCPNQSQATLAPEAAGYHKYANPNYQATLAWSRPFTSRLLLEAGSAIRMTTLTPHPPPGNSPTDIPVIDTTLGITYGSRAGALGHGCCQGIGPGAINKQYAERVSLSYITGSHVFKSGVNYGYYSYRHHYSEEPEGIHGARQYTFANRQPRSVRLFAIPSNRRSHSVTLGAFVQDQWTIDRLTLSPGLRYDSFNATAEAQEFAAGYFVPARSFPEVKNVPEWKNLNPRIGAAYDVFGNGKTAIKASWGRYVIGTSAVGNNGLALNQPIENQAYQADRTWGDTNGNYIPDCVLGPEVPGANGECGALSDLTFGTVREQGSARVADLVLNGGLNDAQEYLWRGSVSLEHELRPGLGITIGYFRTSYGGLRVIDNLLVTSADFDPYCITAPVDPRLPGGGGNQICGLYDIKPERFGLVFDETTLASEFGERTEVFNGVDLLVNARFGAGAQISGGVATGTTVTDSCFVVDSPQASGGTVGPSGLYQCHVAPSWGSQTKVKFSVIYPLPWELRASAVYQNLPGAPIQANLVVRNADIVPTLGRNLGSCRGAAVCNAQVTVNLIQPNTEFDDRRSQLDLRFARTFRFGGVSIEGDLDIYNALNANTVLTSQTRYGTAWLNALEILAGRLFRVGAQLKF